MQDLVIPGWAVVLTSGLGTLVIGWLIWLTLRGNENATKIAVNAAASENLEKELKDIKDSITGARHEFKESFDKLDTKFDKFLSNELQFFKEQYKQKK